MTSTSTLFDILEREKRQTRSQVIGYFVRGVRDIPYVEAVYAGEPGPGQIKLITVVSTEEDIGKIYNLEDKTQWGHSGFAMEFTVLPHLLPEHIKNLGKLCPEVKLKRVYQR